MAGSRPETKTLDRICAIAAAQSGIGAARVLKGYRRWSETEDFQALVRSLAAETQGYFWAALRAVRSHGQTELATLSFAAELVVAVPTDASTDLNAAWEFALALRDALQTEASYGDGEFVPALTVALRGVDAVAGGGIAVFDFGTGAAGGSMQVADP